MQQNVNRVFSLFVIFLFVTSGISIDVKAQEQQFDASDTSTYNNADWSKVTDYSKVQMDKVPADKYGDVQWDKVPTSKYGDVKWGDVPTSKYGDVKWDSVTSDKLSEIKDASNVRNLVTELSKTENRANLKKLNSDQLAVKGSLEAAGNLYDLDQAQMNSAFVKQGLISSGVTVAFAKGTTVIFKDGKLFNDKFDPKGFPISSLKNNPDVASISAVSNPEDGNSAGFVVCDNQGNCDILVAEEPNVITGFEIDSGGNTVVHTTNGDVTLQKGELKGVIDDKGNKVFDTAEGTEVIFKEITFVAHGSSSKTVFTFDDATKTVTMDGAGTISRGSDSIINKNIEGKNFAGKFTFKFGNEPGDFIVSATQADLVVGEDIFSGAFNAEYQDNKAAEVTLNVDGKSPESSFYSSDMGRTYGSKDKPLVLVISDKLGKDSLDIVKDIERRKILQKDLDELVDSGASEEVISAKEAELQATSDKLKDLLRTKFGNDEEVLPVTYIFATPDKELILGKAKSQGPLQATDKTGSVIEGETVDNIIDTMSETGIFYLDHPMGKPATWVPDSYSIEGNIEIARMTDTTVIKSSSGDILGTVDKLIKFDKEGRKQIVSFETDSLLSLAALVNDANGNLISDIQIISSNINIRPVSEEKGVLNDITLGGDSVYLQTRLNSKGSLLIKSGQGLAKATEDLNIARTEYLIKKKAVEVGLGDLGEDYANKLKILEEKYGENYNDILKVLTTQDISQSDKQDLLEKIGGGDSEKGVKTVQDFLKDHKEEGLADLEIKLQLQGEVKSADFLTYENIKELSSGLDTVKSEIGTKYSGMINQLETIGLIAIKGENKEALEAYAKIKDDETQNEVIRTYVALERAKLLAGEAALEEYNFVIDILGDENNYQANIGKADALTGLNKFEEAKLVLTNLDESSDNPQISESVKQALSGIEYREELNEITKLMNSGEVDEANLRLEKLRKEHNTYAVESSLSIAKRGLGEYDSAELYALSAIDLHNLETDFNPVDGSMYTNLGLALKGQKDFTGAIEALNLAKDFVDVGSDAYNQIELEIGSTLLADASLEYQNGNEVIGDKKMNSAKQIYQGILKIDPNNAQALTGVERVDSYKDTQSILSSLDNVGSTVESKKSFDETVDSIEEVEKARIILKSMLGRGSVGEKNIEDMTLDEAKQMLYSFGQNKHTLAKIEDGSLISELNSVIADEKNSKKDYEDEASRSGGRLGKINTNYEDKFKDEYATLSNKADAMREEFLTAIEYMSEEQLSKLESQAYADLENAGENKIYTSTAEETLALIKTTKDAKIKLRLEGEYYQMDDVLYASQQKEVEGEYAKAERILNNAKLVLVDAEKASKALFGDGSITVSEKEQATIDMAKRNLASAEETYRLANLKHESVNNEVIILKHETEEGQLKRIEELKLGLIEKEKIARLADKSDRFWDNKETTEKKLDYTEQVQRYEVALRTVFGDDANGNPDDVIAKLESYVIESTVDAGENQAHDDKRIVERQLINEIKEKQKHPTYSEEAIKALATLETRKQEQTMYVNLASEELDRDKKEMLEYRAESYTSLNSKSNTNMDDIYLKAIEAVSKEDEQHAFSLSSDYLMMRRNSVTSEVTSELSGSDDYDWDVSGGFTKEGITNKVKAWWKSMQTGVVTHASVALSGISGDQLGYTKRLNQLGETDAKNIEKISAMKIMSIKGTDALDDKYKEILSKGENSVYIKNSDGTYEKNKEYDFEMGVKLITSEYDSSRSVKNTNSIVNVIDEVVTPYAVSETLVGAGLAAKVNNAAKGMEFIKAWQAGNKLSKVGAVVVPLAVESAAFILPSESRRAIETIYSSEQNFDLAYFGQSGTNLLHSFVTLGTIKGMHGIKPLSNSLKAISGSNKALGIGVNSAVGSTFLGGFGTATEVGTKFIQGEYDTVEDIDLAEIGESFTGNVASGFINFVILESVMGSGGNKDSSALEAIKKSKISTSATESGKNKLKVSKQAIESEVKRMETASKQEVSDFNNDVARRVEQLKIKPEVAKTQIAQEKIIRQTNNILELKISESAKLKAIEGMGVEVKGGITEVTKNAEIAQKATGDLRLKIAEGSAVEVAKNAENVLKNEKSTPAEKNKAQQESVKARQEVEGRRRSLIDPALIAAATALSGKEQNSQQKKAVKELKTIDENMAKLDRQSNLLKAEQLQLEIIEVGANPESFIEGKNRVSSDNLKLTEKDIVYEKTRQVELAKQRATDALKRLNELNPTSKDYKLTEKQIEVERAESELANKKLELFKPNNELLPEVKVRALEEITNLKRNLDFSRIELNELQYKNGKIDKKTYEDRRIELGREVASNFEGQMIELSKQKIILEKEVSRLVDKKKVELGRERSSEKLRQEVLNENIELKKQLDLVNSKKSMIFSHSKAALEMVGLDTSKTISNEAYKKADSLYKQEQLVNEIYDLRTQLEAKQTSRAIAEDALANKDLSKTVRNKIESARHKLVNAETALKEAARLASEKGLGVTESLKRVRNLKTAMEVYTESQKALTNSLESTKIITSNEASLMRVTDSARISGMYEVIGKDIVILGEQFYQTGMKTGLELKKIGTGLRDQATIEIESTAAKRIEIESVAAKPLDQILFEKGDSLVQKEINLKLKKLQDLKTSGIESIKKSVEVELAAAKKKWFNGKEVEALNKELEIVKYDSLVQQIENVKVLEANNKGSSQKILNLESQLKVQGQKLSKLTGNAAYELAVNTDQVTGQYTEQQKVDIKKAKEALDLVKDSQVKDLFDSKGNVKAVEVDNLIKDVAKKSGINVNSDAMNALEQRVKNFNNQRKVLESTLNEAIENTVRKKLTDTQNPATKKKYTTEEINLEVSKQIRQAKDFQAQSLLRAVIEQNILVQSPAGSGKDFYFTPVEQMYRVLYEGKVSTNVQLNKNLLQKSYETYVEVYKEVVRLESIKKGKSSQEASRLAEEAVFKVDMGQGGQAKTFTQADLIALKKSKFVFVDANGINSLLSQMMYEGYGPSGKSKMFSSQVIENMKAAEGAIEYLTKSSNLMNEVHKLAETSPLIRSIGERTLLKSEISAMETVYKTLVETGAVGKANGDYFKSDLGKVFKSNSEIAKDINAEKIKLVEQYNTLKTKGLSTVDVEYKIAQKEKVIRDISSKGEYEVKIFKDSFLKEVVNKVNTRTGKKYTVDDLMSGKGELGEYKSLVDSLKQTMGMGQAEFIIKNGRPRPSTEKSLAPEELQFGGKYTEPMLRLMTNGVSGAKLNSMKITTESARSVFSTYEKLLTYREGGRTALTATPEVITRGQEISTGLKKYSQREGTSRIVSKDILNDVFGKNGLEARKLSGVEGRDYDYTTDNIDGRVKFLGKGEISLKIETMFADKISSRKFNVVLDEVLYDAKVRQAETSFREGAKKGTFTDNDVLVTRTRLSEGGEYIEYTVSGKKVVSRKLSPSEAELIFKNNPNKKVTVLTNQEAGFDPATSYKAALDKLSGKLTTKGVSFEKTIMEIQAKHTKNGKLNIESARAELKNLMKAEGFTAAEINAMKPVDFKVYVGEKTILTDFEQGVLRKRAKGLFTDTIEVLSVDSTITSSRTLVEKTLSNELKNYRRYNEKVFMDDLSGVMRYNFDVARRNILYDTKLSADVKVEQINKLQKQSVEFDNFVEGSSASLSENYGTRTVQKFNDMIRNYVRKSGEISSNLESAGVKSEVVDMFKQLSTYEHKNMVFAGGESTQLTAKSTNFGEFSSSANKRWNSNLDFVEYSVGSSKASVVNVVKPVEVVKNNIKSSNQKYLVDKGLSLESAPIALTSLYDSDVSARFAVIDNYYKDTLTSEAKEDLNFDISLRFALEDLYSKSLEPEVKTSDLTSLSDVIISSLDGKSISTIQQIRDFAIDIDAPVMNPLIAELDSKMGVEDRVLPFYDSVVSDSEDITPENIIDSEEVLSDFVQDSVEESNIPMLASQKGQVSVDALMLANPIGWAYLAYQAVKSRVNAPSVLTEEIRERIVTETAIEREIYKNAPLVEKEEDLNKYLEIVDTTGTSFMQFSSNIKYAYLSKETKDLLKEVEETYQKVLIEKGIIQAGKNDKAKPLVVTSLSRTTDYQKSLQEQGYWAVDKSTHTNGEAFDISFRTEKRWWQFEDKKYTGAIKETLERLENQGKINLVNENTHWHIARLPVLEKSIFDMKSEDVNVRKTASANLLSLADSELDRQKISEYIDELNVGLSDKDSSVRNNIGEVYSKLLLDSSTYAVTDLSLKMQMAESKELLKTSSEESSQEILNEISALSKNENTAEYITDFTRELTALVDSTEGDIQKEAISVLSSLSSPETREVYSQEASKVMEDRLRSDDSKVVLSALGLLEDMASSDYTVKDVEPSTGYLLNLLHHSDISVRREAANVLGQLMLHESTKKEATIVIRETIMYNTVEILDSKLKDEALSRLNTLSFNPEIEKQLKELIPDTLDAIKNNKEITMLSGSDLANIVRDSQLSEDSVSRILEMSTRNKAVEIETNRAAFAAMASLTMYTDLMPKLSKVFTKFKAGVAQTDEPIIISSLNGIDNMLPHQNYLSRLGVSVDYINKFQESGNSKIVDLAKGVKVTILEFSVEDNAKEFLNANALVDTCSDCIVLIGQIRDMIKKGDFEAAKSELAKHVDGNGVIIKTENGFVSLNEAQYEAAIEQFSESLLELDDFMKKNPNAEGGVELADTIQMLIESIADLKNKVQLLESESADNGQIPAIVQEYLEGTNLDWYKESIELDDSMVDPFFRKVAELEGGEVVLGGGSDLVQLMLGLDKAMMPGAVVEVNVIRSKEDHEAGGWYSYRDVKVPDWKNRKESVNSIVVNSESSIDLNVFVKNSLKENYLINGFGSLNVPLKHSAIAVVTTEGKVRLLFRTPQDKQNYLNKKLTLPDTSNYPLDWPSIHKTSLLADLEYAAILYARSYQNGWKFDEASLDILTSWANGLSEEEINNVKSTIAGRMGIEVSSLVELPFFIEESVPEEPLYLKQELDDLLAQFSSKADTKLTIKGKTVLTEEVINLLTKKAEGISQRKYRQELKEERIKNGVDPKGYLLDIENWKLAKLELFGNVPKEIMDDILANPDGENYRKYVTEGAIANANENTLMMLHLVKYYDRLSRIDKKRGIISLGEMGETLSLPFLMELADQKDDMGLRRRAIRSIWHILEENGNSHKVLLDDNLKDKLIKTLISGLKTEDTQESAAFSLAKLHSDEAIPVLMNIVRGEDPKALDTKVSLAIWRRTTTFRDTWGKELAINLLTELGDGDVDEVLIESISSEYGHVSRLAMRALINRMESRRTDIEHLAPYLDDLKIQLGVIIQKYPAVIVGTDKTTSTNLIRDAAKLYLKTFNPDSFNDFTKDWAPDIKTKLEDNIRSELLLSQKRQSSPANAKALLLEDLKKKITDDDEDSIARGEAVEKLMNEFRDKLTLADIDEILKHLTLDEHIKVKTEIISQLPKIRDRYTQLINLEENGKKEDLKVKVAERLFNINMVLQKFVDTEYTKNDPETGETIKESQRNWIRIRLDAMNAILRMKLYDNKNPIVTFEKAISLLEEAENAALSSQDSLIDTMLYRSKILDQTLEVSNKEKRDAYVKRFKGLQDKNKNLIDDLFSKIRKGESDLGADEEKIEKEIEKGYGRVEGFSKEVEAAAQSIMDKMRERDDAERVRVLIEEYDEAKIIEKNTINNAKVKNRQKVIENFKTLNEVGGLKTRRAILWELSEIHHPDSYNFLIEKSKSINDDIATFALEALSKIKYNNGDSKVVLDSIMGDLIDDRFNLLPHKLQAILVLHGGIRILDYLSSDVPFQDKEKVIHDLIFSVSDKEAGRGIIDNYLKNMEAQNKLDETFIFAQTMLEMKDIILNKNNGKNDKEREKAREEAEKAVAILENDLKKLALDYGEDSLLVIRLKRAITQLKILVKNREMLPKELEGLINSWNENHRVLDNKADEAARVIIEDMRKYYDEGRFSDIELPSDKEKYKPIHYLLDQFSSLSKEEWEAGQKDEDYFDKPTSEQAKKEGVIIEILDSIQFSNLQGLYFDFATKKDREKYDDHNGVGYSKEIEKLVNILVDLRGQIQDVFFSNKNMGSLDVVINHLNEGDKSMREILIGLIASTQGRDLVLDKLILRLKTEKDSLIRENIIQSLKTVSSKVYNLESLTDPSIHDSDSEKEIEVKKEIIRINNLVKSVKGMDYENMQKTLDEANELYSELYLTAAKISEELKMDVNTAHSDYTRISLILRNKDYVDTQYLRIVYMRNELVKLLEKRSNSVSGIEEQLNIASVIISMGAKSDISTTNARKFVVRTLRDITISSVSDKAEKILVGIRDNSAGEEREVKKYLAMFGLERDFSRKRERLKVALVDLVGVSNFEAVKKVANDLGITASKKGKNYLARKRGYSLIFNRRVSNIHNDKVIEAVKELELGFNLIEAEETISSYDKKPEAVSPPPSPDDDETGLANRYTFAPIPIYMLLQQNQKLSTAQSIQNVESSEIMQKLKTTDVSMNTILSELEAKKKLSETNSLSVKDIETDIAYYESIQDQKVETMKNKVSKQVLPRNVRKSSFSGSVGFTLPYNARTGKTDYNQYAASKVTEVAPELKRQTGKEWAVTEAPLLPIPAIQREAVVEETTGEVVAEEVTQEQFSRNEGQFVYQTATIKNIYSTDTGNIIRTNDDRFFFLENGKVYATNVGLEYSDDLTSVDIDLTPNYNRQINDQQLISDLANVNIQPTTISEEELFWAVTRPLVENGQYAYYGANPALDSNLINLYGSHTSYLAKLESFNSNPMIKHIATLCENTGLKLTAPALPILSDPSVAGMYYSKGSTHVMLYRYFISNDDIIQFAIADGYVGSSNIQSMKDFVADTYLKSLAIHERTHHLFENFLTDVQRNEWQNYISSIIDGRVGDSETLAFIELLRQSYGNLPIYDLSNEMIAFKTDMGIQDGASSFKTVVPVTALDISYLTRFGLVAPGGRFVENHISSALVEQLVSGSGSATVDVALRTDIHRASVEADALNRILESVKAAKQTSLVKMENIKSEIVTSVQVDYPGKVIEVANTGEVYADKQIVTSVDEQVKVTELRNEYEVLKEKIVEENIYRLKLEGIDTSGIDEVDRIIKRDKEVVHPDVTKLSPNFVSARESFEAIREEMIYKAPEDIQADIDREVASFKHAQELQIKQNLMTIENMDIKMADTFYTNALHKLVTNHIERDGLNPDILATMSNGNFRELATVQKHEMMNDVIMMYGDMSKISASPDLTAILDSIIREHSSAVKSIYEYSEIAGKWELGGVSADIMEGSGKQTFFVIVSNEVYTDILAASSLYGDIMTKAASAHIGDAEFILISENDLSSDSLKIDIFRNNDYNTRETNNGLALQTMLFSAAREGGTVRGDELISKSLASKIEIPILEGYEFAMVSDYLYNYNIRNYYNGNLMYRAAEVALKTAMARIIADKSASKILISTDFRNGESLLETIYRVAETASEDGLFASNSLRLNAEELNLLKKSLSIIEEIETKGYSSEDAETFSNSVEAFIEFTKEKTSIVYDNELAKLTASEKRQREQNLVNLLTDLEKIKQEKLPILEKPSYVSELSDNEISIMLSKRLGVDIKEILSDDELTKFIELMKHDEYTALTHSTNVANYALELYDQMKMNNPSEIRYSRKDMLKAALLHDIGKLKIVTPILNSPLGPEDFKNIVLSKINNPGRSNELNKMLVSNGQPPYNPGEGVDVFFKVINPKDYTTVRDVLDYMLLTGPTAGISEEEYYNAMNTLREVGISEDLPFMEYLKLHEEYTGEILKGISTSEIVEEIASHHHNYKGEYRPLESEIIQVVDIYSALTEARPYREAKTSMDALKIIRSMQKKGDISSDISVSLWEDYVIKKQDNFKRLLSMYPTIGEKTLLRIVKAAMELKDDNVKACTTSGIVNKVSEITGITDDNVNSKISEEIKKAREQPPICGIEEV